MQVKASEEPPYARNMRWERQRYGSFATMPIT